MNMIDIGRGSKQLGKFDEVEVLEGLRMGRFLPSDMWWTAGMGDWQPLSTFPGAAGAVGAAISPGASSTAATATIPWEDSTLGFFQRWWQTTQNLFLHPILTFQSMPTTGGIGKPFVYALLGIIPGSIAMAIMQVFLTILPALGQADNDGEVMGMFLGGIIGGLCWVIYIAICNIIGLFTSAGIVHLCLMLFGAAKSGLEATFRIIAYANGLMYFLMIVPCLGSLLSLWGLVVYIIGLKEVNRTDYWRVICAVFLPALLCCCIIFAIIFALGGLGALAEMANANG